MHNFYIYIFCDKKPLIINKLRNGLMILNFRKLSMKKENSEVYIE